MNYPRFFNGLNVCPLRAIDIKIFSFITSLKCVSLLLVVLIAYGKIAWSQPVQNTTIDSVEATDTLTELDVLESAIAFPVISYKPETSAAFGAIAMSLLNLSPTKLQTQVSRIQLLFLYTLKKQIKTELQSELFFNNNLYAVELLFGYYKFPDKFYGVGNNNEENDRESYSLSYPSLFYNAKRRVAKNTYIGLTGRIEKHKLLEFQEGGIIDTATLTGSTGGFNHGLGIWMGYDSRDDINFPRKGWFGEVSFMFHEEILGSDFSYNNTVVDLRKYFPIGKKQVIALNTYFNFITGDPPFYRLAQMGGDYRMRGYYEGRFRDRNYMVLQGEYRFPVWWRIGFTVFTGIGQVAPSVKDFAFKEFKYSYGAGFRFNILKEGTMNFRFDYGRGMHGESGIYLQFREAF